MGDFEANSQLGALTLARPRQSSGGKIRRVGTLANLPVLGRPWRDRSGKEAGQSAARDADGVDADSWVGYQSLATSREIYDFFEVGMKCSQSLIQRSIANW